VSLTFSGSALRNVNIGWDGYALFPAVVLGERRQPSEVTALRRDRIAKDHDEAADNREVAEEEVEVENQPIAKSLDHDHSKKSRYGELGVSS
jgi:hypothetical protein